MSNFKELDLYVPFWVYKLKAKSIWFEVFKWDEKGFCICKKFEYRLWKLYLVYYIYNPDLYDKKED